MRGRESKAWRATRSPSLSATQAVSRRRRDGAVDARQAGDRLRTSAGRHRPRRRSGCCARCDTPWRGACMWRADCFQSIARRSMPERNSTSASKSAPSPRSICAIRPCSAWRWKICAPRSCTGRTSGRIGKLRSSADRAAASRPGRAARASAARAARTGPCPRRTVTAAASPRRARPQRDPQRGRRPRARASGLARERDPGDARRAAAARRVTVDRRLARLADIGAGSGTSTSSVARRGAASSASSTVSSSTASGQARPAYQRPGRTRPRRPARAGAPAAAASTAGRVG